ncbi:hypothetical protein AMATHDRAFT_67905 [Amanita thiersii Skay4041]|uniref:VASt domain-containing protein n=1 Tax=Amanita thiersii Skay4041 TaxID=703135 RepID=A0A2A9NI72_9AGAR|nr:hypothetical protein AMATHDRAFT_67905 [Amanita thiersii Skay4041]
MAPSFLTRLVKGNSSNNHNRERSIDRSLESPRTSAGSHSRSRSSSTPSPAPLPPPLPLPAVVDTSSPQSSHFSSSVPSTIITASTTNDASSTVTIDSVDTGSTRPSVTVVPPSPLTTKAADFSASSSEHDLTTVPDRRSETTPTPTSGTKPGNQTITNNNITLNISSRPRTISAPPPNFTSEEDDNLDTPKPNGDNHPLHPHHNHHTLPRSRPTTPSTPSAPSANLATTFKQKLQKSTSNLSLAPAAEIRRKTSSKSLKTPAPITVPPVPTTPNSSLHGRSATTPPEGQDAAVNPMSPIVESPTAMRSAEGATVAQPLIPPLPAVPPPPVPQQSQPSETTVAAAVLSSSPNNNSSSMLQVGLTTSPSSASPRDADSVSMMSTGTTANEFQPKEKEKEKKKSWRRGTANSRKPSGLAGAIAASGLAMANPTMSSAHQAQFNSSIIQVTQSNGTTGSRKSSSNPNANASQPLLSGTRSGASSPSYQQHHSKSRSVELSPRSARGGKSRSPGASSTSLMSPHHQQQRRRTTTTATRTATTTSINSDNNSEYYYELDRNLCSDDSDGCESDDECDLDIGEEDIPVTGFAVASNKRNADFHELFPTIPEGDYLIEDYGCALQREILIQGRLYISENHICFHANILGWITDLSIPIYDITTLEKRMTAFVIPNAIQITTRHAKYTFASFLSRDTTFDVIYNIWRHARPEDGISFTSSPRGSLEGMVTDQNQPILGAAAPMVGLTAAVLAAPKFTECACGREGKHFSETPLEVVMPGTPDRIHNLMFASGFIKEFMAVNQKLMDIQMSDWAPLSPGSTLLTRNMSYIKPLNGSLGPKQTKCEIKDETAHYDPDDYMSMLTTTRTPEVPSGGVFSVKTRTCIMWAGVLSSKVVVTTQVEWTGRSFIKGIIEKSAIDGQKVYHAELEKAMKAYIQEHQAEFVPAGADPSTLALADTGATAAGVGGDLDRSLGDAIGGTKPEGTSLSSEEAWKKREHERNRRGLQWAWDTFSGAADVAKRSTKGALELIRDAWEQSSMTTILYFVITILVLSNAWTLARMGGREEVGRRKEMRRAEEREKWVQGVVAVLRDELVVAKAGLQQAQQQPGVGVGGGQVGQVGVGEMPPVGSAAWKQEVGQLRSMLDGVEERARALKESLDQLARVGKMSEVD